jgi:hypothetical protein
MPMPFHCIECDKPVLQALHTVCPNCLKRSKNMVSSSDIGEDLKRILPSEKMNERSNNIRKS